MNQSIENSPRRIKTVLHFTRMKQLKSMLSALDCDGLAILHATALNADQLSELESSKISRLTTIQIGVSAAQFCRTKLMIVPLTNTGRDEQTSAKACWKFCNRTWKRFSPISSLKLRTARFYWLNLDLDCSRHLKNCTKTAKNSICCQSTFQQSRNQS